MPPRRILRLAALLMLSYVLHGGEAPGGPYAAVLVAPAKTSIYLGSVTLTMPVFTRDGGTYATTYVAKVFPYFFLGEQGQLWIDASDEQLRRLEHGETVEFTGHARTDGGRERRVTGQAVPADATSGRLKVRVFVSRRIDLVFNTTYQFGKK